MHHPFSFLTLDMVQVSDIQVSLSERGKEEEGIFKGCIVLKENEITVSMKVPTTDTHNTKFVLKKLLKSIPYGRSHLMKGL